MKISNSFLCGLAFTLSMVSLAINLSEADWVNSAIWGFTAAVWVAHEIFIYSR